MIPDTYSIESEAEALCATARWCYARGWVPATSGNFSVRDRGAARMLISPSGLDKGVMTSADLLKTGVVVVWVVVGQHQPTTAGSQREGQRIGQR